jgi:hypothetical protein
MQRASVCDASEFVATAEYVDRRAWIAESDADYGVFVGALTRARSREG